MQWMASGLGWKKKDYYLDSQKSTKNKAIDDKEINEETEGGATEEEKRGCDEVVEDEDPVDSIWSVTKEKIEFGLVAFRTNEKKETFIVFGFACHLLSRNRK